MNLLIKQAVLVNDESVQVDVRIKEGVITEIGTELENQGEEPFEAKGHTLVPGFVDVHIHLREPGGEKKETIKTGTLAAARGGFTTVAAMPNTRPVPDSTENMKSLLEQIHQKAHVRVIPYASITERLLGEELVDMPALAELGAFAFTDDGVGIQSAGMMYKAMATAVKLNKAVVAHCEDNSLIYGGCMHEGKKSQELNLPGIPSICESVQIARDVLLAEATGCHYHVCHVSTKESVRVIRDAKKAGIRVTAEVTPHHLLLSEDDILEENTMFKMNPPLRAKEDQQALLEGLEDGTIDFIATDHAPHTAEEKAAGMKRAPFGIVGLETAFTLLYTHFVKTGSWTLSQLLDWLTVKPAEVFQLPVGSIEIGKHADLVLLDLTKSQAIDASTFLSKGRNTPFDGRETMGWPVTTIVNGKLVWQEEL
ncbi:dihydroorotase [Jeotgalibacillus soli]|uniref:Dihydroorotase n=1 Tax=Jeotgalibacillus soli TaxID=889306 RepID=A0A0C2VK16_9BACL|nr:dihydroorotase [Jeotgalibacillus soli]KIL44821.1 dihydroorotase [Jeotgalibacillus soli]